MSEKQSAVMKLNVPFCTRKPSFIGRELIETNDTALVHRYGLKFYVSLDESRIGWAAVYRKMGLIEGRKGVPFYAARMAAAPKL